MHIIIHPGVNIIVFRSLSYTEATEHWRHQLCRSPPQPPHHVMSSLFSILSSVAARSDRSCVCTHREGSGNGLAPLKRFSTAPLHWGSPPTKYPRVPWHRHHQNSRRRRDELFMMRDCETPALCALALGIMTDFGVAPLAGGGQIMIYTVQPCSSVLRPGQRVNGGAHAAFISCKIQRHQILNTSLWSAACLVGQNSRPARARRK